MAKKNKRFGVFSGLNPSRLLGSKQLREDGKVVSNIGRRVLNPLSSVKGAKDIPQDFDACMRHFNVSEEDLKTLIKNSTLLTRVCSGMAGALFIYFIYLVFAGSGIGCLMALVLCLLALAYAYRESLNVYRLKHRKVKCTVGEWFNNLFKRGNKDA